MKAKDVMSRTVVSIPDSCTLADVVETMLEHDVSGVPVVDSTGRLVGIVTEGDLLRRRELGTEAKRPRWLQFLVSPRSLAEEYAHAQGRSVREVMTPQVAIVGENAELDEIVRMMERYRVKRLPVMSEGRLVGIVSRADLVRALAKGLVESTHAVGDDEAIRDAILTEIHAQPWAPARAPRVSVHDGVVRLEGAVYDESQRKAMRVVAENVAGVKAVDDRLTSFDPLRGAAL